MGLAVPVKHTGEPDESLALPYDMEPRRPSVAAALVIGLGALVLPLLYLVYAGAVSEPVALGLAAVTVVLMLGFAWLGSRLYYTT